MNLSKALVLKMGLLLGASISGGEAFVPASMMTRTVSSAGTQLYEHDASVADSETPQNSWNGGWILAAGTAAVVSGVPLNAEALASPPAADPVVVAAGASSPLLEAAAVARPQSVLSSSQASLLLAAEASTPQALELSKGAVVIKLKPLASAAAASETGSSTIGAMAGVDTKRLLTTLLVRRQELASSIGRMKDTVAKEFREEAVWQEVAREVLSIEGDLASLVDIKPPSDFKALAQDLSRGKLNLLVNGEVVNVSIQRPVSTSEEDTILIEIKGYKGNDNDLIRFLEKTADQREERDKYYGPIRRYLARFDSFWYWWDKPVSTPSSLSGFTNGEATLAAIAGSIAAVYGGSYSYYQYEQEEAAREAEAKREALAAKKKAKAAADAAAKKKKEEAEKSKEEKKPKKQVAKKEEPKAETPTKTEETAAPVAEKVEETTKAPEPATQEASSDTTTSKPKGRKRRRLMFWRRNKD